MTVRPLVRSLVRSIDRNPFTRRGGRSNPLTSLADLFATSAEGGFYGFPYEPGVGLFQERTGAAATTPALVGDPVGTVLDKSGTGRHRVAAADAARPILRQNATTGRYYLEYDAVDDALKSAATFTMVMPQFILAGLSKEQDLSVTIGAFQDTSDSLRLSSNTLGRMGVISEVGNVTVSVSMNDLAPVGQPVIVTSQSRSSYVDVAINGEQPETAATTWTTQSIGTSTLGQTNTFALHNEYGFIQLSAALSDQRRREATTLAGTFLSAEVTGTIDVFVFGGQSNSISRADALADAHPADCYQFDGATTVAATVPLRHIGQIAGDVGPDVAFATAWLAANPGHKILFVPAGEGATAFGTGYWRSGGEGYNRLVNRTNAALAAHPTAVLRGVFMALGENDTLAAIGAPTFQTYVDQFVADIREDITGGETVPVVWGGMAPEWVDSVGAYRAYQTVLSGIGARLDYTAYADSEAPSDATSIAGDIVHFDRAGITAMGGRYYDALLVAQANTP